MYISMTLATGDLSQRNDDPKDKSHNLWNLYHYAIKGFQAHYDYLVEHEVTYPQNCQYIYYMLYIYI